MDRVVLVGRWQPLHEGHIALINAILNEGSLVFVGIRDTESSEENPYSVDERGAMIEKEFGSKVSWFRMPDFDVLAHGREVGYRVVELPENIESISGTELRRQLRRKGML